MSKYISAEEFEAIPEGSFVMDANGGYYIKPAQLPSHHLDGMFIQLFTGKLSHYSLLHPPVIQKYGAEICW